MRGTGVVDGVIADEMASRCKARECSTEVSDGDTSRFPKSMKISPSILGEIDRNWEQRVARVERADGEQ